MRESLQSLLRNATLVTVAFGIALGWALLQVGVAFAEFVSTLLTHYPSSDYGPGVEEPLTWRFGGHILTFGGLLRAVIELGVIVLAAAFVRQWTLGRSAT